MPSPFYLVCMSFIQQRLRWEDNLIVLLSECGFTFQNHFDLMGDRSDNVGGIAVVEARLVHHERGSINTGLVIGALEPQDTWRWVPISFTDELFGVTTEHRDRLWKFCGINGGLIC